MAEPSRIGGAKLFQDDGDVYYGRVVLSLDELSRIAEAWLADDRPSAEHLRLWSGGRAYDRYALRTLMGELLSVELFPVREQVDDGYPDSNPDYEHNVGSTDARAPEPPSVFDTPQIHPDPPSGFNAPLFTPDLSGTSSAVGYLANVIAEIRGRKVSTTRPRVVRWASDIAPDYREAAMRLVATEWERSGWNWARTQEGLRELLERILLTHGSSRFAEILKGGGVKAGDRGGSPARFNALFYQILEELQLPQPKRDAAMASTVFYVDDCLFSGNTLHRHVRSMVGDRRARDDEPTVFILTLAAHQPEWDMAISDLRRQYRHVEAYTTMYLQQSLSPGWDVLPSLVEVEPSIERILASEQLPADCRWPSHRSGDVDDEWLAAIAGLVMLGFERMPHPTSGAERHTANMRPMGFDLRSGVGFGTPFVSWWNIPNGSPLALWSRPMPLVERITNASRNREWDL